MLRLDDVRRRRERPTARRREEWRQAGIIFLLQPCASFLRRRGEERLGRVTGLEWLALLDAQRFELIDHGAIALEPGLFLYDAIEVLKEAGVVADRDLEAKDAYAYIDKPSRLGELESEAAAARSVGFEADVLSEAPLPFETAGALRFKSQAQFNPASYLVGLAGAITSLDGKIFENTPVTSVEPGRRWHLDAGAGALDTQHVVIATNLPVAGPVAYDERTRPRCHVAMAFQMKPADAINGMFIGIDDPTHSLRMGRDEQRYLLVALGPTFTTGHDGDVAARFCHLEEWGAKQSPRRGRDMALGQRGLQYSRSRPLRRRAIRGSEGPLYRDRFQRLGHRTLTLKFEARTRLQVTGIRGNGDVDGTFFKVVLNGGSYGREICR